MNSSSSENEGDGDARYMWCFPESFLDDLSNKQNLEDLHQCILGLNLSSVAELGIIDQEENGVTK